MYLTHLLHRFVQQAPNGTMTVFDGRRRTAAEVIDRVARLAGALTALGLREGDRVSLLAHNSDRYHETFFATWWAGAVISPANVRWSVAEIAYALDDSASTIVLVDSSFVDLVPQLREACSEPPLFVYCGEGQAPEEMSDYETLIASTEPVADRRCGGDALAALLYTGGTTGFPKGVMCTHQGMMTSMLGTQVVAHSARRGDVALIAAPMFHTAAIAGWLAQSCVGGTCVFLPSFDPVSFMAAVQEHRVTMTALVPTMLQMVVDHPRRGEFDLTSVRTIGYGASPITTALLERALDAFGHAGFHQGYGMTETMMVSQLANRDHLVDNPRLRSAGQVVPHCEVIIADADGADLGRHQVGEILVRGDAVTPGYWNKPAETRQAIRDGWMHTGDAGYLDEDGYLFVVDRLKDMIVTGGENVYSAEVELALASHPAVASCAVIGVPDSEWGERVHAFIVMNSGAIATTHELRDHCRTSIAGYKCPRSIDLVDSLPISTTGKVLKRALRNSTHGQAVS